MKADTRLMDEWVPVPSTLLKALGWAEDQPLELEVVGDALVCTPRDPKPNSHYQHGVRD